MNSQQLILVPPSGGSRQIIKRVVPTAVSPDDSEWHTVDDPSILSTASGPLVLPLGAVWRLDADELREVRVIALLPDPTIRGLVVRGKRFCGLLEDGERMRAMEILIREPVTNSRYAPALTKLSSIGVTPHVWVHGGVRPDVEKLEQAYEERDAGAHDSGARDLSRDAAPASDPSNWVEQARPHVPWLDGEVSTDMAACLDRYREITLRYRDEVIAIVGSQVPWI